MREFRRQWSRDFSLTCEMALRYVCIVRVCSLCSPTSPTNGICNKNNICVASYQGHTKNTSSSTRQKYQPYIFSGNTWLGFILAGAVGVAGIRVEPCNHQLQPREIPALYSRRIRRVGIFAWWSC